MKRIFYTILLSGLFLYPAMNSNASASHHTEIGAEEWVAAPNSAWPGKDNIWYKLDEKANLWWSKDGKKWEASKDGLWQDKEGKWLKIGDKKLWWSTDGKNWSEVPEWKWQGTDGKWYKFDQNWAVWVNKK